MLASHSSDALSVPPLGQVEPAGPEPPPAHSLGKVGEDDMGRSGQLVLVFLSGMRSTLYRFLELDFC